MASYTYPEAAEYLRVEERWLRRNISRLPHSKKGRTVTFTQEDLDRIDQMHHYEPTTGPLAAPLQPSTVRHPMAHLRPLPSRRTAVRV
ncbi:helix-turn-helix domain-containing protein [Streptomyces sp. NPDC095602]|uniref:helix-turn-helix domain-containing protein n=1 Tax=Streptomyces sp. NPDC095602 TaxID=3155819 RepID=UPI0033330969